MQRIEIEINREELIDILKQFFNVNDDLVGVIDNPLQKITVTFKNSEQSSEAKDGKD